MIPGETVNTTSDERVMAALSHFFGLIAAVIVWATQKDRSRSCASRLCRPWRSTRSSWSPTYSSCSAR